MSTNLDTVYNLRYSAKPPKIAETSLNLQNQIEHLLGHYAQKEQKSPKIQFSVEKPLKTKKLRYHFVGRV